MKIRRQQGAMICIYLIQFIQRNRLQKIYFIDKRTVYKDTDAACKELKCIAIPELTVLIRAQAGH